jgi:hypothetical protein
MNILGRLAAEVRQYRVTNSTAMLAGQTTSVCFLILPNVRNSKPDLAPKQSVIRP